MIRQSALILLMAVSSLNARAHVACESNASGLEFVAKNISALIALGEQTSPALSEQGRMLLAVSALKSGLDIAEYNRAEAQVPNTIGGDARVVLDGEERAVIAVASVEYKKPVSEIMERVAMTLSSFSTKERILLAISSVRSGRPIEWLNEAADAVRNNP